MSLRRPPVPARPLTSEVELTAVWQRVLAHEPLRFRALWVLFLDEGARPTGPLITVDDLPDGPYDIPESDLLTMCGGVLDGPGGGGSVAFLLTRPGRDRWTVSDRAWGRFLIGVGAQVGAVAWPAHWARTGLLEPVRLPEPVRRSARRSA
ncbi:MAG: hypothetical protein ACJ72D_29815 [Marmoricola sp.]